MCKADPIRPRIPVHFNGRFQGARVARAFATASKSPDGRGLPAEAVQHCDMEAHFPKDRGITSDLSDVWRIL
jgi:hypothetical protein